MSDKNMSSESIKGWYQKMDQKYGTKAEEFLKIHSTNLAEVPKFDKKDKKALAKEKNDKKEADAKKQAPVQAEKKQQVVNKKKTDDVSDEYKSKVKNLKIQRLNKDEKILPKDGQRNIMITSALPYVNNVPHLGNLIGCVLSGDTFARYARLRGWNTIYISGTDEYGTATEFKAVQMGKTPKEICDYYNKIHSEIYEKFDLDFDFFGRTTTEKHTKIAQELFMDIYNNGYFVEKEITQFFCNGCQKSLADRFVSGECPFCKKDGANGDQCDSCGKLLDPDQLINPKCNLCHAPPVKRDTNHLFIDLTTIQPQLAEFIDERSKSGFWTNNTTQISLAWLKNGLEPRCMTRD